MKALNLVVSEKKIFENCILKTYFWPRYLMLNATKWTTLVEEHLGIIPVKSKGQNPMSGFRGEVNWMKVNALTHRRTKDCHNLSHFVLMWAKKD